ncbi:MAG: hypothetical protein JKY96_02945 [Phycisphaerales bacterium]|nr:hypothetical protein [Phycisphaerales bacterium]
MSLGPQIHSPDNPEQRGNAILPAAVLFGSLIAGFFEPAILFFGVLALGWLAVVVYRRRQVFAEQFSTIAGLSKDQIALKSRSHFLGLVLNASDIPIIVVQGETIILANRAAELTFGGDRALTNTALDELITHQSVLDLASRAINGESGHTRIAMPIAGQGHDFDVAVDPLESELGCVLTFRDITELANAVALKADFASNASHELRTPIASIRGAVDTLMDTGEPTEAMRERMLAMIARNASRLELLVNDLLDLSRLESPDSPPGREQIALADLVADTSDEFSAICARRSVTIEPEIENGLEVIASDPVLVKLIVRNLIENAAKFTKEDTSVRVQFSIEEIIADPQSKLPQAPDHPRGLQIRVRDKGVGIAIAEQQRIFERFYRINEPTNTPAERGTGLGLAIVKHACKRLGGSISVRSVYGQGTTMIVDLPNCVGADHQSTNK